MGRRPWTLDQFINKSREVHGDKYDYSLSVYNNKHSVVKIICPNHGVFEQMAGEHVKGCGCKECTYERYRKDYLLTTEDFKIKASVKHNNFYDYSKSVYTGWENKIIVTCPEHGDFKPKAGHHLSGMLCKKCGIKQASEKKTKKEEDIIKELGKIHNYKYTYPNLNYTSSKGFINVQCEEHGEFSPRYTNHYQGGGCLKCFLSKASSEAEKEVLEFVYNLNNKAEANNYTLLNFKELDIYIHDIKLGIEYNGLYWHSDEYKKNEGHKLKTDLCNDKGIELIQIYEDEWLCKKDIVKHLLKSSIITEKTIYPNLKYKQTCIERLKDFISTNSINYPIEADLAVSLISEKTVVSCILFNKTEDEINIKSVISKLGFNNTVISEILKEFLASNSNYNITFNFDRRWGSYKLFTDLGFKKIKDTCPTYEYVINSKTRSILNKGNNRKIYNCGYAVLEHKRVKF